MRFRIRHTRLISMGAVLLMVTSGFFLTHCKKFEVSRKIIVKTEGVSEIMISSCKVAGSILDQGSTGASQHGFCWSLTPNPAEAIDCNAMGPMNAKGAFSTIVEDLTPGTAYYFWAYAEDSEERSYGEAMNITTLSAQLPTVETGGVINIGSTFAEVGYNIFSNGGSPVTERGLCWGTETSPSVDGSHKGFGSGTGEYIGTIDGLTPNTDYYYRAYAINAAGIGYGATMKFITPPAPLVDDRNGKTYQTVVIGNQIWMAENLDIGTKINSSLNASENTTIEKYCYQNNDAYCEQYGALYSWEEMMQYNFTESSQGICPDGWHVPSDEEWKIMEMTLGMSREEADGVDYRGIDQGGKLKATGIELWDGPNEGATNESGFTALPAGGMDNTGYFSNLGFYTEFWTSSWDGANPWQRVLDADHASIFRTQGNKGQAMSVRCVKD